VGPENVTLAKAFGKAEASFPIPIANPTESPIISSHILGAGEGETAECPGTFAEPKAEPGHFCVYTQVALEAGTLSAYIVGNETPSKTVAGAVISSFEGVPGGIAQGSWAVTAP
jgi:hypothetical protein